jgi:diaminobutyrate-2-oxoglutarate transaminase
VPFDGYLGPETDTLGLLEALLADSGSGLDLPAAVILETTQAEGGINVASTRWLIGLQELCRRYGILLIIDDIQVGCGRTGPFFSFEEVGLDPDIICLSKSLSGVGLPLAIVLLRPELDLWKPGEHNGTFRGNNAAFVTATAALETFWSDDVLRSTTAERAQQVHDGLQRLVDQHDGLLGPVRGSGLIQGVVTTSPEAAASICAAAFARGLVVETAGPEGEVVKLLPALTTTPWEIDEALEVLADAIVQVESDLEEELTVIKDSEERHLERLASAATRGSR